MMWRHRRQEPSLSEMLQLKALLSGSLAQIIYMLCPFQPLLPM